MGVALNILIPSVHFLWVNNLKISLISWRSQYLWNFWKLCVVGNKTTEPKEKKTFLDTIKLPLVSVLPKKKKDDTLGQQSGQAGLASMETLDDKGTEDKNGDDLKNVPLDDKTDVEQQAETKGPETCGDKLRLYRSAICKLNLFSLKHF